MLNKIFSTVDILKKGLDASYLRHGVIANNIANAETPGFKASRVKFETLLKHTESDSRFKGRKTNEKHFDIHNDNNPDSIKPLVVKDTNTAMTPDGNNVDIDVQMVELAKNTIHYNLLTTKVNKELGRIKLVLTETR